MEAEPDKRAGPVSKTEWRPQGRGGQDLQLPLFILVGEPCEFRAPVANRMGA